MDAGEKMTWHVVVAGTWLQSMKAPPQRGNTTSLAVTTTENKTSTEPASPLVSHLVTYQLCHTSVAAGRPVLRHCCCCSMCGVENQQ